MVVTCACMIASLRPRGGRRGTIRACPRSASTTLASPCATSRPRASATSASSGRASRRASASRNRAWRRSHCCSARAAASSCSRRSAEDTPVGRFLARRGEGMHHLAFAVDDLPAELAAPARGRRDADRRAAAHGDLRSSGIRAPLLARRRAERAGAGDDGDGGVMDDGSVKFELGFRGGGTVAGEASARGLGARRGRAGGGQGHRRHRARRAPHLAAHRRCRLRRARRASAAGARASAPSGVGRPAPARARSRRDRVLGARQPRPPLGRGRRRRRARDAALPGRSRWSRRSSG